MKKSATTGFRKTGKPGLTWLTSSYALDLCSVCVWFGYKFVWTYVDSLALTLNRFKSECKSMQITCVFSLCMV